MIDLRPAMKPKSDQLNADDLTSGPITIRIREIKDTGKTEQRFWFYFDGDDGKPWKPCKGMLRVMAEQWGFDGAKYIGRSLTLYRDPKAKWSGQEVGGIRISHMSDLKKEEIRTVVTVSRGRREEYRVWRLVAKEEPITTTQTKASPNVDLEAIAKKINTTTAETIEDAAKEIKKETGKWPRDEKLKVSELLRARRGLLGVE